MMFTKAEFAEWRDSPMTQQMLKDIADQAQLALEKLVKRTTVDSHDDHYLRGVIAGVDQAAGWEPEYIPEEGEDPFPVQDALKED